MHCDCVVNVIFDMSRCVKTAIFGARRYLGVKVGALLHQSADCEPKSVSNGEIIQFDVSFARAVSRPMPLVWAEPGHYVDSDGYHDVCGEHVQPNV